MTRRWLDPEFFTDEKMKKATVPERLLAAAIIANQDDDGRLRGDPAYLRAKAFLYDDYSLEEVQLMRDHLSEVNPNIIVYENAGEAYIQLKRYKRYQRPRYYHPSKLPAPPSWPFEESNQQGTTQQPSSTQMDTKQELAGHQVVSTGEGEGKGLDLDLDLDLDLGKGEGAQRHPPPSPATSSQIYDQFIECFQKGWGQKTTGKSLAQIRDFSQQLSAAGCPVSYVPEAFKEAAKVNKLSLSYVRAILFDWLGVARGPP